MLADMGGTSFDVCVITEGVPLLTTEAELEWGIPYCQPMVDVRSIGAGGGSIAWLDSAGILHVGPQSAGASGARVLRRAVAICPPSLTRTSILGRLSADLSLAGDVELDSRAGHEAIARIADPMDSIRRRRPRDTGDRRHNMASAIEADHIDRGLDPRDFALMAFGGAGPLHAASLLVHWDADGVVPIFPGAFSAFGALIADSRFDYLRTALIPWARRRDYVRRPIFDELEGRARADLTATGPRAAPKPRFDRRLDLRYRGQAWELEIAVDGRDRCRIAGQLPPPGST